VTNQSDKKPQSGKLLQGTMLVPLGHCCHIDIVLKQNANAVSAGMAMVDLTGPRLAK